MSDQPTYLLFAGINGAGKSTLYRSGLWEHSDALAALPRVNSDEILLAHDWDPADPKAQMRAGKEAVRRIEGFFDAQESFNQETTLSGRSIMRNIEKARALGYCIIMNYVGLEDPRTAIERVAYRVSRGGHAVSDKDILRRARTSSVNLLQAIDLCDEVRLFDNTESLRLVACFSSGILVQYVDFPQTEWADTVIAKRRSK